MKKNIFSKISVMVLLFCSIVVMSACSVFQKEGVNITGIEVVDETVPTYILAKEGEFDKAGIKIKVRYSDGDSKDITVTTQMIPEEYQDELLTPGEYDITILFKGHETVLHVKIAEVANVYTVRFYNGLNNLISVQEVKEGEDAVVPNSGLYAVAGYEFIGWDRPFTNITEDMDVNATYIKVESTLTEELLEEKFFNAINNTMTTSHTSTVADLTEEWEDLFLNNFHYDAETGDIELQTKGYTDGVETTYYEFKNGVGSALLLEAEDEEYKAYGEISKVEMFVMAQIYTPERINNIIQDEPGTTVEYSYLMAGNKTTYYCTITQNQYSKYVFSYNDKNVMGVKYYYGYNSETFTLVHLTDYIYSESEVEFEDWSEIFTEEPEEVVANAKSELLEAYNSLMSSDIVVNVYEDSELSTSHSIKYDYNNKVSAEYSVENELLNIKWEEDNTTNCYDGTSYTTVDGILSFIPNFEDIIESGKYKEEDVLFAVSFMGEACVIEIDGAECYLEIEIIDGKIASIAEYWYLYNFEYEDVELVLPDDIKNKTEGAELKLN